MPSCNYLSVTDVDHAITATLTRAPVEPQTSASHPPAKRTRLTAAITILLYGVAPMAIGVLFNYFVIFEHVHPSFMGLLLLQPAWALLSYCVAFALMSGGSDHSFTVSKTAASCTLTRRGLLFSTSRSIPLSSVRRFRVATSQNPALSNEQDDSGTNAYGIEAVWLGTRFVFGYVLDKSACVALAEQLQIILEDAHENGKEGCPPPALLPSSSEYDGAATDIDESAALVSQLPKGSVVTCRRRGCLGHLSIVLRPSFPRQTAMAAVLVNFEWYMTLVMSLVKTETKVGDIAGNWFVISGSAISAGAVILVFGAAFAAEKWVLDRTHVRCWRRFGLLPERVNVAHAKRVELYRTKRRTLQKMIEDQRSGGDWVGGRRLGLSEIPTCSPSCQCLRKERHCLLLVRYAKDMEISFHICSRQISLFDRMLFSLKL